jgi:hypothetical protein
MLFANMSTMMYFERASVALRPGGPACPTCRAYCRVSGNTAVFGSLPQSAWSLYRRVPGMPKVSMVSK